MKAPEFYEKLLAAHAASDELLKELIQKQDLTSIQINTRLEAVGAELREVVADLKALNVKLLDLAQTPLTTDRGATRPSGTRDMRQKVARCGYLADGRKSPTFNGCGAQIMWMESGGRRRPFNLDGTPHRCQSEGN